MSKESKPHHFRAQLISVAFFTSLPHHVLSRRAESMDELIMITGGSYKAHPDTVNGPQTITAHAGDIVYWPSGSLRTEENDPDQPLKCICVYFRWPDTPRELPPVVHDDRHVVDLLADRLLHVAKDPADKLIPVDDLNQAYLNAILAEYITLVQDSRHGLIASMTKFIEEHITEPIRLEDLARHAGLEKHHFGRKYKQLTGRTPIQDVLYHKALHAKQTLMNSPSRTLRDIANTVGIRNESMLSRLITRYAGTSAREIKRATRR